MKRQTIYIQHPTVIFYRVGVYYILLIVVFKTFETKCDSLKVVVNDLSSMSFTLTLKALSVKLQTVDSKALAGVLKEKGNVIIRRNAIAESEFSYFDNTFLIYPRCKQQGIQI